MMPRFLWSLLLLGVLSLAEPSNSQAETSTFSCQGRVPGYYADPESGCQAYHMCEAGGRKFSYRCPEHTLFQQRMMVCDHWFMVDCRSSPQHYGANLLLGDRTKPFIAKGENVVRELQPSSTKSRPPGKRQQSDVTSADVTTPLSTIVQQYTFPSTIITSAVRARVRGEPIPTSGPNRTSPASTVQQVKPTTFPRDRLSTTPQFSRQNAQTSTPVLRDRLSQPTTVKISSPVFTTKLPFTTQNTQSTKRPFVDSSTQSRNSQNGNRNPSFTTTSNNQNVQNVITQTTRRPFIDSSVQSRNSQNTNRNPSVTTTSNNQNVQNVITQTTRRPFIDSSVQSRNSQNRDRNPSFTTTSNTQNFISQTTRRPIIELPLQTSKLNPTSKFPFNTQTYVPQTTKRPLGLSSTTLSLIKSSFNLTSNLIQTTTYRPTTQLDEVLYPATINSLLREDPPLLRLIVDPRRMFYIGDDEPSVFEQSLQYFDPNEVENRRSDIDQNIPFASPSELRPMKFSDREGRDIKGACPRKCLPAFMRPGTCEPCVMLR